MKNILFVLIVLVTTSTFAQETILITNSPKKEYYKEVYHALKKDKTIKHGSYKKYDYKNRLEIEGFYNMGQKDSIWREYTYDGQVEKIVHYSNDKKNGVYQLFHYRTNEITISGQYSDD